MNLLNVFIAIGILVGFLFGMTVVASWFLDNVKDDQIEQLMPLCEEECRKYNMEFQQLVNDGWTYDCWCIGDRPEYIKRFTLSDIEGEQYNENLRKQIEQIRKEIKETKERNREVEGR